MRRLTLLVLFAGAALLILADYASACKKRGRGGHGGGFCGHGGHGGHGHFHHGHHGHCGHGHCAMPHHGHHGQHHAYAQAPAVVVVHLPADAVLTIDGHAVQSTSAVRTLRTPNLEFGHDYVYTLRAEVGDQVVSQQVSVRAGRQTTVRLEPTVALTQR
jgi:uncharacterized protein (TIGR03000 family)